MPAAATSYPILANSSSISKSEFQNFSTHPQSDILNPSQFKTSSTIEDTITKVENSEQHDSDLLQKPLFPDENSNFKHEAQDYSTTLDPTTSLEHTTLGLDSTSSHTTLDLSSSLYSNSLDPTSLSLTSKKKTRQYNSEERSETESDDPEEDFSHLSPEEQAVLSQISKIIRRSL